jgi:hypothetical protein
MFVVGSTIDIKSPSISSTFAVPIKQVTHYANSKPWITRDIRDLLKKKRSAFASGDKEELRIVQKELKKAIWEGKKQYKQKLEAKLEKNN